MGDIRNVLLLIHGVAWLVASILAAARTGTIPAELWGVLPFGIGAILAAFKVDGRRETPPSQQPPEGENHG